jgi:alpha-mannosidase
VRNQFFTVTIDQCGRITSLIHVLTGNEAIVPDKGTFGNQLVLFDDIPLYWDAWDCMDYHLETRAPINVSADKALEPVHVELAHPLKVTLKWSHSIGQKSHISQRIHISAVDPFVEFESTVQWAENRKFLKVEFPVNVHSHQVLTL